MLHFIGTLQILHFLQIDFIVIVSLLLSHWDFSFVFGYGLSFLVGSSVSLLMVVQQLWFWCSHKKWWERVFYPAILNWSLFFTNWMLQATLHWANLLALCFKKTFTYFVSLSHFGNSSNISEPFHYYYICYGNLWSVILKVEV